jgi:hypothetical protein
VQLLALGFNQPDVHGETIAEFGGVTTAPRILDSRSRPKANSPIKHQTMALDNDGQSTRYK